MFTLNSPNVQRRQQKSNQKKLFQVDNRSNEMNLIGAVSFSKLLFIQILQRRI